MKVIRMVAVGGYVMTLAWMVWAAGSAWGEDAGDWFKDRMDAEAYASASAERLEGLPLLHLMWRDRTPLLGVRVVSVEAGSAAERAGLRAEQVITGVPEGVLWDMLGGELDADGPLEVTVWDPAGGRRAVERKRIKLPEGTAGVELADHRHNDLIYVRLGRQDPAWDRHVFTAMRSRSDPDLMETAWAHAVRAGYPIDNGLVRRDAAWLAFWRGRNGLLDRLNERPLYHQGMDPPGLALPAKQRFAINLATGRIDRLPQIETNHKKVSRFHAHYLHGLADRMGDRPGLPNGMTPAEAVEARFPFDLKSRLASVAYKSCEVRPDTLVLMQQEEPFTIRSEPGVCWNALFGVDGPVRDFMFEVRFTIEPTGPEAGGGKNALNLAIHDGGTPRKGWGGVHSIMHLRLHLIGDEAHPHSTLYFSGIPGSFERCEVRLHADGKTMNTVRMIRLGDRGEVLLNGCRLALVPLDPERVRPVFQIHGMGVRAEVERLTLVELAEGIAGLLPGG
ncbi:MAG: hypothetical protein AAF750_15085 [Planctomycetota bacterium]